MKVNSFEEAKELSSLIFGSTYVSSKTYSKVEDVFCVILAGQEMGIGPITALREFHNIKGKWEVSGSLMLALAINRGVIPEWERTDSEEAILLLSRHGVTHRHTFSMSDARRAGLATSHVWRSYPAAMLRARCASAAIRCFAPDAISGGSIYVHGEVSGPGVRETTMARDMTEEVSEVIQRRQPNKKDTPPMAETEELSPGQAEVLAEMVTAIEGAPDRETLLSLGKQLKGAPPHILGPCEIAYSVRLSELAA